MLNTQSKTARRLFVAAAGLVLLASVGGAQGAVLDLTTIGSMGTINGAQFRQFDPDNSTGSGVIDSFVRVQSSGTEQGYNTDGSPFQFDEVGGGFTHSLQLGEVPVVSLALGTFREFLLDVNEAGGGNSKLSLDELEFYVEDTGNLLGYPGSFSAPVYDLDAGGDNYVLLDAANNSGSGGGDMILLVPNALFGTDETKYVYLFSRFGDNEPTSDGFEEWAHAIGEPIIPEPATGLVAAIGGIGVLARRKRR